MCGSPYRMTSTIRGPGSRVRNAGKRSWRPGLRAMHIHDSFFLSFLLFFPPPFSSFSPLYLFFLFFSDRPSRERGSEFRRALRTTRRAPRDATGRILIGCSPIFETSDSRQPTLFLRPPSGSVTASSADKPFHDSLLVARTFFRMIHRWTNLSRDLFHACFIFCSFDSRETGIEGIKMRKVKNER